MSAAKFFIPTLPGLASTSTLSMYGGHIPSAPPINGVPDTTSDAHLYFFMVRNRHIADTPRTIIWFNGGPGCSSFDGSFMEVGPIRLVPGGKGELKEVEGAWNEYANIIFGKCDRSCSSAREIGEADVGFWVVSQSTSLLERVIRT